MKAIITVFLLMIVLATVIGCTPKPAEEAEEVSAAEIEEELAEIDALEEDIDLSELDSLEEDLDALI